jgi:hypothetical protein
MSLTSRSNSGGERSVNKLECFTTTFNEGLPHEDTSIVALIEAMDAAVRAEYPQVSGGALNNCHGDWYEWLLAICAWNTFNETSHGLLAVQLPNIRRFDCAELYVEPLFQMVSHLRNVVRSSSDVELITSNPDFVILDHPYLRSIDLPARIEVPTSEIVTRLGDIHLGLRHLCSFDNIRGYLASKFSLRPDRRLQIPHEGSLMKALYVHLQTRLWLTEPRGLRYYAVAAKVSRPDIDALRTVATHSITTVSSKPQPAVDEVFAVDTLAEAREMFQTILLDK